MSPETEQEAKSSDPFQFVPEPSTDFARDLKSKKISIWPATLGGFVGVGMIVFFFAALPGFWKSGFNMGAVRHGTVGTGERTQFDADRIAVLLDQRRRERELANNDGSTFSPAVGELMQYLRDLKAGRAAFNWSTITGEEAAKQFGFSRLFASSYEELRLFAEARIREQGSIHIRQVIAEFEDIVSEEKKIDQMMAGDMRLQVSIAYLRALQNGDVVFPHPAVWPPPSPVSLLRQLASIYPNETIDEHDRLFPKFYDSTWKELRADRPGAASVQRAIKELRKSIAKYQ